MRQVIIWSMIVLVCLLSIGFFARLAYESRIEEKIFLSRLSTSQKDRLAKIKQRLDKPIQNSIIIWKRGKIDMIVKVDSKFRVIHRLGGRDYPLPLVSDPYTLFWIEDVVSYADGEKYNKLAIKFVRKK